MKSALITGASRGIGRGIALALAQAGYGLTITSRHAADLDAVGDALRAAGAGRVTSVACDMADHESLSGIVETHQDNFGSMNALIINAGVGTAGNIGDFELRRLDKLIAVNFTAAFILIKQSLPMLRQAAAEQPVHGAKIMGLSSMTGAYGEAGLAAYGASKAALLSLLETVNLEESARGVTATAIAPAYVNTDMAAWVSDRIPVSSMIPVEDVVRAILMILELSSNTVVSRLVLARSGTSGYCA